MRKSYPRKTTGVDPCSIPGCKNLMFARTWCSKHYARWYKHGDPLIAGRQKLTDEERFWPKVEVKGKDECWPWLAYINRDGYGQFRGGGQVLSHRFAYQVLVGEIPKGMTLDHLCRNPSCQNPAHLEPVTNKENALRGTSFVAINARKTHCPKGHPYDEENTYVYVRGEKTRRVCRACQRQQRQLRRVKEYPAGCIL